MARVFKLKLRFSKLLIKPYESDPRDMGIQTQRIDTFIQADGICIKVGCSLKSRDFFVILH